MQRIFHILDDLFFIPKKATQAYDPREESEEDDSQFPQQYVPEWDEDKPQQRKSV
jgi:hypothetical protein